MRYSIRKIGVTQEEELDGRSFVGVSRERGVDSTVVVMPYGVDISDEILSSDREEVRFLKKYVRVIQRALTSDRVRERLHSVRGIDNPTAAVNLLHDYLTMGPLVEYETVSALSERGKIDFSQTVKKVTPTVAGGNIFFDRFITRKKEVRDDSFVARVQGSVINDFMKHKGGEILFGQSVSVAVNEIDLDDEQTAKVTLVGLRRELSNTFNSRKENIIRWCIAYIESRMNVDEEYRDRDGDWNYAVVASTLWEAMVDEVFGSQDRKEKDRKSRYGKTYSFTPIGDGGKGTGRPTEHDTIYENDTHVFVIDAKMYGKERNLLSEDVLGKQFGYYVEARKKTGKKVVNVLVLPQIIRQAPEVSDKEYFQYHVIEDPHSPKKGEPGYDPDRIVLIYKYPVRELIDDYYRRRKRHMKFLGDYRTFINTDNPSHDVKAFLADRGCTFTEGI